MRKKVAKIVVTMLALVLALGCFAGTVLAEETEGGGYGDEHTITYDLENVTVDPCPETARAGEEISFTYSCPEGYEITDVVVTTLDNLVIETLGDVNKNGGNRRFIMPDDDISIWIRATEIPPVYNISYNGEHIQYTNTGSSGRAERRCAFCMKPEEGYAIKSVRAVTDGGEPVTLSCFIDINGNGYMGSDEGELVEVSDDTPFADVYNGMYYFWMPADNVTITAVAEEISPQPSQTPSSPDSNQNPQNLATANAPQSQTSAPKTGDGFGVGSYLSLMLIGGLILLFALKRQ